MSAIPLFCVEHKISKLGANEGKGNTSVAFPIQPLSTNRIAESLLRLALMFLVYLLGAALILISVLHFERWQTIEYTSA
jgi:hypothetical protein